MSPIHWTLGPIVVGIWLWHPSCWSTLSNFTGAQAYEPATQETDRSDECHFPTFSDSKRFMLCSFSTRRHNANGAQDPG
ncbi:hypothetical protein C8R43DRAFT_1019594 [Mycena crocata]|nr:hypothetical protein C8R43DRAFT_1019594 [Mycena crocata]